MEEEEGEEEEGEEEEDGEWVFLYIAMRCSYRYVLHSSVSPQSQSSRSSSSQPLAKRSRQVSLMPAL